MSSRTRRATSQSPSRNAERNKELKQDEEQSGGGMEE
eukprot:CAMPEP_0196590440 /NCGR_PEP_ID=MMETSP1081-20130531/66645_1 /TAXON_ID=36882 /ORGANISM="Pyramimonas amylifera, Strain CCMP720" /LENGTH=36 /DNA_ID= /DNA_START= /DNA_END= /DNA_ORIENTATION=